MTEARGRTRILLVSGLLLGQLACMGIGLEKPTTTTGTASRAVPPGQEHELARDHPESEALALRTLQLPWAGGGTVHAIEAGESFLPPVLMVHGSPGRWTAYRSYLQDPQLLQSARLLALDRPGFGLTTPRGAQPSLRVQAQALEPLLQREQQPVILVGHSYGGPVVVQAAVDFPERVAALVLVAPSVDPELERLTWYQRLARRRPVRWLLSRSLASSLWEILPLRHELQELAPRLGEIRVPVTVIQGQRDRLVPPGNADYVQRAFTSSRVQIMLEPKLGHLILWSRPDLVRQAVLAHLPTSPSETSAK